MPIKKNTLIIVLISIMILLNISNEIWAISYEVGQGMTYENIGDVPWESINAGDSVLINYRAEPYREKWVIARTGTGLNNIVIYGVPGSGGELPVIDGQNATTRQELSYWSEERGIINIGGSNYPSQIPNYIVIENLDIRNARPPYSFTDDQGQAGNYSNNASSVYVIEGDHITVRNCIIHDCGDGFFVSHNASNVLVEGCYIYDNGIEGSIYQHNNYTEAKGIIFQYNYFGHLRTDCNGNNLKDRSSGTIIRYNWIEGGSRQIDLVDSDYSEIYNDTSYRKTFVYGNILIEQSNEGNSQICHYGGDGGNTSQYRKGTLYFYNNTVISKRSGYTTLLRLSTNDEYCDARNNIIYVTENGNNLALLDAHGTINIRNNWFKSGWANSHQGSSFDGNVIDSGGIVTGDFPGFEDWSTENYHLGDSSSCIDMGSILPEEIIPEYNVNYQYIKHCQHENRPFDDSIDIGAFEYGTGGIVNNSIKIYPNPCKVYMGHNSIMFNNLSSNDIIKIYNITGKLVHNSGNLTNNKYRWSVNDILSGVYFYKIVGNNKATGKIVVIR
ncbi:T9SS type A sorting domain-containing protein [candidate division WOR-3 bacterium]|nr:T9SS type A sorting domain-containing protein [candidate division WOR-3 bacterium]